LPTAEKAFAKEGVDADKYMLSKAIYLGDVRVSGSGDTRAPALQAAYQFALSNNVKLPAWVFTYTMVADFDITRNTAFSNMVIIFVGPNNQASIIGGAPPSSE
jgi:hypothetical protein